jgi:hypothetical protein
MAKQAGYQVLYNEDGTATEHLLFQSCCPSCGETFLASGTAFEPVTDTPCPRCCWAFELARCCDTLALSNGVES